MEPASDKFEIDLESDFYPLSTRPSNLRIYMGGLVIAHRSDKWSSVFLEHQHHALSASYLLRRGGVSEPVITIPLRTLGDRDRRRITVQITPETGYEGVDAHVAPTPQDVPTDHSYLDHFGDFSGAELHNEPTIFKEPERIGMTLFEIDHGLGYTATIADGDDGIPDLYRFDKGSNRYRPLGHFMGIANLCSSGSDVVLQIDGRPLKLPRLEPGVTIDILLHNACTVPQCYSHNDFPLYYWPRGIVANRPPINLSHQPRYLKDIEEIAVNFRVACNLMLASSVASPFVGFE